MKHPKGLAESPQHHFCLPPAKPLLHSSPNAANPNSIFAYEPTSVLDPNLTSSPATAPTAAPAPAGAADLPFVSWGAGSGGGGAGVSAHNHHLPSSDDWDAASLLLPERYEFSPFPDEATPHFLDSAFDLVFDPFAAAAAVDSAIVSPSPGFERSQLDSLVSAAHCLELKDFATAHVILSRLNHQLPSSGFSPLQRAIFLFKEALLALLRPSTAEPPLSAAELVRHIVAHKAFADLSPAPHFAAFTATQTLIETVDFGARSIHLIDFDLGLGAQWSSFLQELATRSRGSRSSPPAVRVTAVGAEDSGETTLAADHLRDFARGLNINLSVSFVRVGGLGTLALSEIRLGGAGEPTAVVLTPSIFRLLGCGGATSAESAPVLLRIIRRMSPRVVVFVDPEGGLGAQSLPSLRRTVAAGVEHYAAVLESVETAAAVLGAGEEAVRRVERTVVRPRVSSVAGDWSGRPGPWREVFVGAGWSPVQLSEFAESQAKLLVRRARVDGYHVARRDGALVLSWKGRELSTTSVWKC